IDARRESLCGHESFHELEIAKFNEFTTAYIDFTNSNNRLPEMGHNVAEDDLYLKYREYLGVLSRKNLMGLLNKFNFKLTVEEIVLTGNYPNKDELYSYFDKQVENLSTGRGLDKVALKVLKKLKSVIPIEYGQLKDYLEHKKDARTMIDDAIKTLEDKGINAEVIEGFQRRVSFIINSNISRAMKIINKYALYVTNEQFKKMLDLGIKLPKTINMSLEERLEKLGGYDSFYEKERYMESNVIEAYFSFIEKNGRRPNASKCEEELLAKEYDEFLFYTSVNRIKVLCASIDRYKLEHSFIEKALLGERLDENDINIYVKMLIEKAKKQGVLDKKDLKMLRVLVQYQKFGYRQEAIDMITVHTVYNKIYS
ncbi:MAG: hypothetical protein K2I70_04640, partial [Bacilli bacterium]|nr:hypothetical protein [Bacilli bacterium]